MNALKGKDFICPGDKVRVMTGPAAGRGGIVSSVQGGKAHVVNLFHGAIDVPITILKCQGGSEDRTT